MIALACCAVLVSGAGLSEGAVRVLECTVEQVCDAGGTCEGADGTVSFRLEPVQLQPDGAGRYTISYADVDESMQAQSELGPFYWKVGSQRNALVISSETQWLWHTLDLEPAPAARIRFLECRLTS